MPFYLNASDIFEPAARLKSVLIVPCRFCPAASLAVRDKKPYIELFRKFLRTEAYESFIQSIKLGLRERGIEADVFDSKMPHHYVACMWSDRRRRELAERARKFEGVVVLGCEATVETVRDSIESGSCRVIQGMEIEGLMNILPKFSFPFTISREVHSMTSMTVKKSNETQKTIRVPNIHPLSGTSLSDMPKLMQKKLNRSASMSKDFGESPLAEGAKVS